EAQQLGAQTLGRVLVVMQMDLDLAKPRPAQTRQRVEILLLVLLDRKKERVARRPTVAVLEGAELPGILLDPGGDALPTDLDARLTRLRLEVIGDAENDVNLVV